MTKQLRMHACNLKELNYDSVSKLCRLKYFEAVVTFPFLLTYSDCDLLLSSTRAANVKRAAFRTSPASMIGVFALTTDSILNI